jgi:mannosyltransferase
MNTKIAIDGIIFSLQNYGGISVYFRELIKKLNKENIQAELLLEYPLKQKIQNEIQIDKVERVARYGERFRKCRLNSKDIVFHSSYYRVPDNKKTANIVTVHDFINEKYNKGFKKAGHTLQKIQAIKSAQTIICISETTKRDLYNYVDIKSNQDVCVIYNGVSEDYKPIIKKTDKNKSFILFVGERGGYKNFELALKVIQMLPDVEIYCVGGKKLDNKELEILKEKELKRVKYLGKISNEELNQLYNNAICLIYPSQYEGFGIPVIEAMKAGCPVIASNKCEVIKEIGSQSVIRVNEDPRLMADAINELRNDKYRKSLIELGLINSKEYGWDKCHKKTIEIYNKYV